MQNLAKQYVKKKVNKKRVKDKAQWTTGRGTRKHDLSGILAIKPKNFRRNNFI
jgi:hypothetical protein